jgi:phage replication O-like protein O
MAKKGAPQVEDGYTRLANELLEALAKTRFTNSERRLLDAIFRLTYGIYGRRKAEIELNELVSMTEISKAHICRARKALMDRGVLTITTAANKTNPTYQFNKYYKNWKPFSPAVKIVRGGKDVSTGGKDVTTGGKDVAAGENPTSSKENIKESIKETGGEKPPDAPDPPKPKKPPPPYKRIIEYFNSMTGSNFKHENDATRAQIRARFKTGFTEQDFKDVIKIKTDQWLGNPRMLPYLRPGTLFRPSKFESYLQEAQRSGKIVKSEKQRVKERRFRIAAGILEESGQEACLRYCQQQRLDGEEFKAWILKNTKT